MTILIIWREKTVKDFKKSLEIKEYTKTEK